jgi:acetaldehyde dehydrogenase/alcohol dehydrogenase
MQDKVDEYLINSKRAGIEFASFSQEKVDKIVQAIVKIGIEESRNFAKMAVEETGMGKWEDKEKKNLLSTQYIYEDIKNLKTVGVISNDKERQIMEIAHPLGPILAIVPVTNPTSTLMFKIIIALKTRNPIILSLPQRAKNVCSHVAEKLYEEALKEGVPKNSIQWVSTPNREMTRLIMKDERLALILATGGKGLVSAAYSSGTPALGVGPGNVPVLIEESSDIEFAIEQIMISKTFDNGTICASEQAIVVEKKEMKSTLNALEKFNAYLLKEEEIPALEKIIFDKEKSMMSARVVGQSALAIAQMADLNVPKKTSILVAKQKFVGQAYPLSSEILAPVIALYEAEDFNHALKICMEINAHGGTGHTASIFSNNEQRITQYSMCMNTSRIIVNSPSSQGAVGGLCNNLSPSLTLGCGSGGGNSTTDNISAKHLLNIQRIAKPVHKVEVHDYAVS